VALFAAIAGMVLLSTMIAALVILARNENMIAQLNKDEAQAAYAAEAGANWGRKLLAQRLIVDLPTKVVAEPRASMGTALKTTYNSKNGAALFIRDFAIPASGPTFSACTDCVEPSYSVFVPKEIPDAQQAVLTLTCPGTVGCPAGMSFATRVIVGAHPTIDPLIMNGENRALFTYVWRIESSGTSGRARQQWVIHDSSVPDKQDGAFTIAVTAEFVKYAHFIDQFQDAGSGDPWMSFRHKYTGPVHTNTRFSILGNIGTTGQEGPTFKSEATQTMDSTRFNNGGKATNLKQDSSAKDWPILGQSGIFCKTADCSGFTRAFDFNPAPSSPGIDPIPFPSDPNGPDRRNQVCKALGVAAASCTGSVSTIVSSNLCGSGATRVIVSNNCGAGATLAGGIYVNGSVREVLLANVENVGQTIVIYTGTTNPNRRTVIEEGWNLTAPEVGKTRVRRECLKTNTPAGNQSDSGTCNGTTSGRWFLIPTGDSLGGGYREQVFTGVFSPDPSTDNGVIYVAGNIGLTGTVGDATTLHGLRRGTFEPLNMPSGSGNNANSGINLTPTHAIFQDTGDPNRGMRLTVAADGNIFIAGPLNYRFDPRGADGYFSDPTPGDPAGTSADDNLNVQNVLGIVSWGAGMAGGVRLSAALDGDLDTHGMVFVANLSGNAEPSGQFSFDDPDGAYRGESTVVGGVVQKTMGTFGQPSSNTGYARKWLYDERLRYKALSPPAFPGFPNFTAATSLGIDSYTWRLGLF
jgi:hypothetical protein